MQSVRCSVFDAICKMQCVKYMITCKMKFARCNEENEMCLMQCVRRIVQDSMCKMPCVKCNV